VKREPAARASAPRPAQAKPPISCTPESQPVPRVPLAHAPIVDALAVACADLLPGSGNAAWSGHVNFGTVAAVVGVGEYWRGGTKAPAVTALFTSVLENRPQLFARLVVEIVRAGITYRGKKGRRITRAELETIVGLILQLGYRFPDLTDPSLLDALDPELSDTARARARVELARTVDRRALDRLQQTFLALSAEENRNAAGRSLEGLLNELFGLFGLAPRAPFRLVGEEIDGSFELDHETYLLEAKWERKPISQAPLLVFRGKVDGKSAITRGVFLSINGYTHDARQAIVVGKQPNFLLTDGNDVMRILQGAMALDEFLRRRRRLLAEGQMSVPFSDLITR
jgi:hypothetical protein